MYTALNGWTKSDIIEAIKNRGTEGRAAGSEGCQYLVDNDFDGLDLAGSRCAVGAFFPKAGLTRYDDYEGTLSELVVAHPEVRSALPLSSTALMEMQVIHDTSVVPGRSANEQLLEWINENVQDAPAEDV